MVGRYVWDVFRYLSRYVSQYVFRYVWYVSLLKTHIFVWRLLHTWLADMCETAWVLPDDRCWSLSLLFLTTIEIYGYDLICWIRCNVGTFKKYLSMCIYSYSSSDMIGWMPGLFWCIPVNAHVFNDRWSIKKGWIGTRVTSVLLVLKT